MLLSPLRPVVLYDSENKEPGGRSSCKVAHAVVILPFQNLLVPVSPGDDEETTFTLETRPISVTSLEFCHGVVKALTKAHGLQHGGLTTGANGFLYRCACVAMHARTNGH